MKKKFILLLIIFFPFVVISYSFGYNYDCNVKCESACGSNYICLIQCYSCCPTINVKDEQTCNMCGGDWYQDMCYKDSNHTDNNNTTNSTIYNAAPSQVMDAHTFLAPPFSPFEVVRLDNSHKSNVKIIARLEVPQGYKGKRVNLFWMYCLKDMSWCSSVFSLGSNIVSSDNLEFSILPYPQDLRAIKGDFFIYVDLVAKVILLI